MSPSLGWEGMLLAHTIRGNRTSAYLAGGSGSRSLAHLLCLCRGGPVLHWPQRASEHAKAQGGFWPRPLVVLLCDLRGVPASRSLGVPTRKTGKLTSEGLWVCCPGGRLWRQPCPSPVGRSGVWGDAGSRDWEFTWVPFLLGARHLSQGTKF